MTTKPECYGIVFPDLTKVRWPRMPNAVSGKGNFIRSSGRNPKHDEANHEDALREEDAELREQLALYVRGVVDGLPEPHREP